VATIIVDDGSLLSEIGRVNKDAAALFEAISKDARELYLILVQRQRLAFDDDKFGETRVVGFPVPPLSLEATKRLLIQSLKGARIPEPGPTEIDELVPYLGGYPPAVNLAYLRTALRFKQSHRGQVCPS